MNILVTGGAGFIGSHTCAALRRAGYNAFVFDNGSAGNFPSKCCFSIRGDIRDSAHLKQVVKDFKIEGVLHFAALLDLPGSFKDPASYYQVNVGGTANVLDATRGMPIVFSSTCAVYEPRGFPIAEFRRTAPTSPYGSSKLMAERMIQDSNPHHVILRYFNAAGPGDTHTNHLIPSVLEAMGTNQEINVYGADYRTPDGSAIRDYVHVADLADAHVRALEFAKTESGIFNLGSGCGASVLDVIRTAERVVGNTAQTRIEGPREGDAPCLIANTEKARKDLGWAPKFDLEDMIRDAWISTK